MCRYVRKYVPDGAVRVLNVGIGNGWLERQCAAYGWDVYSLDPDRAAAQALASGEIRPTVGQVESLPFRDQSFDAVFCSEVIEHLDDAQLTSALNEIMRVLKVEGLFVGTVPHRENLEDNRVICPHCGEPFHRWGHQQTFDKTTIRHLMEDAGLRVARVTVCAFRDYAEATVSGLAKFLIRWPLAKAGSTLVYANIFFAARKPVANSWTGN